MFEPTTQPSLNLFQGFRRISMRSEFSLRIRLSIEYIDWNSVYKLDSRFPPIYVSKCSNISHPSAYNVANCFVYLP